MVVGSLDSLILGFSCILVHHMKKQVSVDYWSVKKEKIKLFECPIQRSLGTLNCGKQRYRICASGILHILTCQYCPINSKPCMKLFIYYFYAYIQCYIILREVAYILACKQAKYILNTVRNSRRVGFLVDVTQPALFQQERIKR